jgi:hypothetical protein
MSSSQEGILSDWAKILAAVEAHQEDLTHIEDLRAGLAAGVETLRTLRSDRDLLRTELQRATDEIQQALGQGKDLASRIRAGVRSTFGIHSDKLTDFGIKPIQSGKKQKGPAPR